MSKSKSELCGVVILFRSKDILTQNDLNEIVKGIKPLAVNRSKMFAKVVDVATIAERAVIGEVLNINDASRTVGGTIKDIASKVRSKWMNGNGVMIEVNSSEAPIEQTEEDKSLIILNRVMGTCFGTRDFSKRFAALYKSAIANRRVDDRWESIARACEVLARDKITVDEDLLKRYGISKDDLKNIKTIVDAIKDLDVTKVQINFE